MKILLSAVALLLTAQVAIASPEIVSVEGTFVDRDTGRGLPGASIELYQRHWGFPDAILGARLASTTTDAKGEFRFAGPWRGKMRLICYSPSTELFGGVDIRGAIHDLRVLGHRRIVLAGH